MAWGKLDDKFHRNRKVRALRRMKGGKEALGTWVFWWSWCLDDPELTGLVPDFELDSGEKKAAELLVEAGLWERVEDGYRFHDFHDYNPTREQVEAKKAADRERLAAKRSASRSDVARDTDATNQRVASTRVPQPLPSPNPSPCDAREGKPSTEAVVRQAFSRAYEQAHAVPWPYSQAKPEELRSIADWVDRVAERDGLDASAVVERVIRHWSADPWVERNRRPWKHFAKHFADHWQPAKQPVPANSNDDFEDGQVVSW